MIYVWVTALSVIGPFFWPLNNGVIFAAAVTATPANPYGLALALATGSTLSFGLWYLLGRFSRELSPKWKERMNRMSIDRFRGSTIALTLSSAAVSLPPLTPVALLLGSTRSSPRQFLLMTWIGRLFRFGVSAWAIVWVVEIFERSEYYAIVQSWLM